MDSEQRGQATIGRISKHLQFHHIISHPCPPLILLIETSTIVLHLKRRNMTIMFCCSVGGPPSPSVTAAAPRAVGAWENRWKLDGTFRRPRPSAASIMLLPSEARAELSCLWMPLLLWHRPLETSEILIVSMTKLQPAEKMSLGVKMNEREP